MSTPSFLLANDSNHTLLHSLLEVLNAIVEHQYSSMFHRPSTNCTRLTVAENPNFIYAIYHSRRRFYGLREFTLEGGQAELEKQAQLRKEQADRGDKPNSMDSIRSPTSVRSPNLSNVPEEHSAFAIGDDDSDEGETATLMEPQAYQASVDSPRPDSVSSADEALPIQLRGMSEKARGKMPAGQSSFSRQNSISSIHGLNSMSSFPGQFQPTPEWVGLIG
jgi:hypothetical protein